MENKNSEVTIGSYLSDFVYGGIDGSVTTFAIVAGVTGASLSPTIVLILGFANLFIISTLNRQYRHMGTF